MKKVRKIISGFRSLVGLAMLTSITYFYVKDNVIPKFHRKEIKSS